jgi:hypothetical protein
MSTLQTSFQSDRWILRENATFVARMEVKKNPHHCASLSLSLSLSVRRVHMILSAHGQSRDSICKLKGTHPQPTCQISPEIVKMNTIHLFVRRSWQLAVGFWLGVWEEEGGLRVEWLCQGWWWWWWWLWCEWEEMDLEAVSFRGYVFQAAGVGCCCIV